MFGKYKNIKIQGIASAVPSYEEDNSKYEEIIGKRQYRRQTRITGASKRRLSPRKQKVSDLCYHAATRLLDKLDWKPEEIKVLILVTQVPDYAFPSTAFLLQKLLGIPKDCIVFDMNLGCSSFPIGVQVVSALLQTCGFSDKGLLLLADTAKSLSYPETPLKKSVITHNMLFGSAGSAVALEKVQDGNELMFMSKADGNFYDMIIKRFGMPTQMDGGKVFDFAINDVSKDLMEFRNFFQLEETDIDYYVFHQAQRMILNTIADACGIEREKELRSIEEFGNTSGVSVPLSICANRETLKDKETVRLLCYGFGVGLSWGITYFDMPTENILPLIETDEYLDEDKTPTGSLKERTVVVAGADTPMGECICRYLSKMTAEVLLVGKDRKKCKEISEDLYTESYVYEGDSEELPDVIRDVYGSEYKYPIKGIVFVLEGQSRAEVEAAFRFLNEDEERKNRIVLVGEKSASVSLTELVGELDKSALSEELCVNGVTYDANKMEIMQMVHESREWVDEFFTRGCPKEMKRQFHVAQGVSFFLSRAAEFTSGTVMRVER